MNVLITLPWADDRIARATQPVNTSANTSVIAAKSDFISLLSTPLYRVTVSIFDSKQSRLYAVIDTNDAGLLRAVRAAVNLAISFDPMADDSATAVSATRREGVNRAFETIEHMRLALGLYLETLVIIISADFTFRHMAPLLLSVIGSTILGHGKPLCS